MAFAGSYIGGGGSYSGGGGRRRKLEDMLTITITQGNAEEFQPEEGRKMVCLYGTGPTWLDSPQVVRPISDPLLTFVAKVAVSIDRTTETTDVKWVNQCRCKSPPMETFIPIVLNEITGATSLVSLGTDVYCIGGEEGSNLPSKEVTKFNTSNPTRRLEPCPTMIKDRAYPAVVSIGMKLYVFGGLSPFEEQTRPWAEFLDTSKPIEDQKWEPLHEPIIRPCRLFGCTQLFVFPYDRQHIVIGCSLHSEQRAVFYDVTNGSSSYYKYLPKIHPWGNARPVTVFDEKTIYWIQNSELMAFELDKQVSYCAKLTISVFPEGLFLDMETVPLLVHLKDNLFGFFTMYVSKTTNINIIECHKVRVSKGHPGVLRLSVVGYQCYRCDPMHHLSGVVSI